MSQYLAQVFGNPLVKMHLAALRAPARLQWLHASLAALSTGSSGTGPWSQVAEFFFSGVLFPPSTWPLGPSSIFSKDWFLQEASDPTPILLPSGQVCTDPSDGALLRPHTEPEASLWFASSIAVGSRESVPFPFWLSIERKGQDATCDGALDLMVFPIKPVVKTSLQKMHTHLHIE